MTDRQDGWLVATVDWSRPLLALDAHDVHAEAGRRGSTVRLNGRVKYSLLGPEGGPALDDPIELSTARSPAGFDVWYGKTLAKDGSMRRDVIAPGTYGLRAEHAYYDPLTRVDVEVPQDRSEFPQTYRFDLVSRVDPPNGTGRIEVRGVLRGPDGSPVGEWPVRADDWGVRQLSRADGSWVLRPSRPYATEEQSVTVDFEAHSGTPATSIEVTVRPGLPVSVEQSAVSGRVIGMTAGLADARVAISTNGVSVVTTTSDAAGRWWYFFPADQ